MENEYQVSLASERSHLASTVGHRRYEHTHRWRRTSKRSPSHWNQTSKKSGRLPRIRRIRWCWKETARHRRRSSKIVTWSKNVGDDKIDTKEFSVKRFVGEWKKNWRTHYVLLSYEYKDKADKAEQLEHLPYHVFQSIWRSVGKRIWVSNARIRREQAKDRRQRYITISKKLLLWHKHKYLEI